MCQEREYYIASCSCGKDSLAMVLRLLFDGWPLNEILFYDTGMEFQAIYRCLSKLSTIASFYGVKVTILKPSYDFCFKAFEKLVKERGGGTHLGYSWCGGKCRWGTTDKLVAMDKYAIERNATVYVGIAADEEKRFNKERASYKVFPLVEWGMTEADCLSYCRSRRISWQERTSATETGYIDLYDILDRVSCWCCANKNRKELKNIYRYLPNYWEKLKEFQSKTSRPMKRFSRKGVSYGNVFQMEELFRKELENENHQSVCGTH